MAVNGNNTFLTKTRDLINSKGAETLRLIPANSVLFTKSGASTLLNQRAILAADSFVVSHIGAAIPSTGVECKWLFYFLQLFDFATIAHATNMPSLPLSHAKAIEVPLAPRREQARVIAKIEELFSELDKGIESLKTARRQLEVYRQSVLKQAFEGKLTAQWREENKDELEAPKQLLARIKKERAAQYALQLQEWSTAVKEWEDGGKIGTKPPKPKAPANVAGIAKETAAELPGLPAGWGWFHLDSIADVSGGITKNRTRSKFARKMKYLRVANVYADKILTDNVHEIGVMEAEAKKVALEVGDLLVVEGNGSMDQIGRVGMWNGELPVCGHQNHLIRVRVANGSDPRFVLLFLLSPQGRDLIVKEASSTSGLHTLSISKVSKLAVPATSLAEEAAVVAVVDEKLQGIDRTVEEIETQFTKSETLRQSILKKAFAGQLVAQDSHDEPASVLLKKIGVGREKANNRSLATRRTRKAETTT